MANPIPKTVVLAGAMALAVASVAQRGTAGYTAQVNAGQRALGAKHFAEAAEHFRYALVFNASGVDAHNGLGDVYLKLGKRQRALEEFAEVLRLSPHSSEAERGIHEARTEGQEARAFEELSRSVERDPKNADLQTTYAEELIERGRYDEAKQHANLALQLSSQQWHAHCALGRIAAHEGDDQTAEDNLRLAVRHDYTDDDAWEALGMIEMKRNHAADAVVCFQRLVALLPDEAEGHELLAKAFTANGQSKEAAIQTELARQIQANVDAKK